MTQYTIVQRLSARDKAANGGEDLYLNHAYLHSCAFGSADMMWTTHDHEQAASMLKRARKANPDAPIGIEELPQ